MKPLYIYGGVLLLLLFLLPLLGFLLVKVKWLRPRQVISYARLCTLLFVLAAYAMPQYGWPGVHLRTVDLWSLLLILGILGYSLMRAALLYAIKDTDDEDHQSYMLSMLYTDTEQLAEKDLHETR